MVAAQEPIQEPREEAEPHRGSGDFLLDFDLAYAQDVFMIVWSGSFDSPRARRYTADRPIVVTTNQPFAAWSEVFPNAACVVTLVDRLVHRSEILNITGESYRLKEARERAAQRKTERD